MIKNLANYAHPFGDIAEQIKRARREREQRAEFYRETKDVVERALGAQTFHDINGNPISETAKQILVAGMRRRGELPPDTQKLTPKARAILNAARKRDNLPEIE